LSVTVFFGFLYYKFVNFLVYVWLIISLQNLLTAELKQDKTLIKLLSILPFINPTLFKLGELKYLWQYWLIFNSCLA